jgi:hypothetical protein
MPENHERFKIDPASHFAFRSRKAIPALDGFSFIPPDCPERKGMFSKVRFSEAESMTVCRGPWAVALIRASEDAVETTAGTPLYRPEDRPAVFVQSRDFHGHSSMRDEMSVQFQFASSG